MARHGSPSSAKKARLARIAVVCVLVSGVAPTALPASPPEPILRGVNQVTAIGSAWVEVTLAEEVVINHRDPASWVRSLHSTGAFSGVMIRQTAPEEPRQALLVVRLFPPLGCEAGEEECQGIQTTWSLVDARGQTDRPPDRIVLDPGKYQVYALAEAGEATSVSFELPGLDGSAVLEPAQPVATSFRWDASYPPSGIGVLDGRWRETLSDEGLLVISSKVTKLASSDMGWRYASFCIEQAHAASPSPMGACETPLLPSTPGARRYSGGAGGHYNVWLEPGTWDVRYTVMGQGRPERAQILAWSLWIPMVP